MNIEQIKQELKAEAENNPKIALTGRVKDWLNSSESRYPVSCTTLSVEDSMEGKNGIEYSWAYVSKALRYAAGVSLDLSKLRGKGVENGKGLVSSGAVSFMTIYSKFNEVLRRGGIFKNGGVSCFLDAYHPDIEEFLTILPSEIPWVKRAVYIDANPDSKEYILNHPKLDLILDKVRDGSIWLAKKVWQYKGEVQIVPTQAEDIWKDRLFSNLCLEILLKSNATCLLTHVNLGQCRPEELEKAFVDTTEFLCKLHAITGAGEDNYYLPPNLDRQIGVGVIGLANFLAREEISYQEFSSCLYDSFDWNDRLNSMYRKKVVDIVGYFRLAYYKASQVAKKYNMDRGFCIAPSASMSYSHLDLDGYTTTPEISPPICSPHTKKSVRDSGTLGTVEYQYPPNVETAEEVGYETYFLLANAWQQLMNIDGLAHSISFNVWNECECDVEWLKKFLNSSLLTTYYRMNVTQASVDKTSVENIGIDIGISEEEGFFMPEGDTDETTNSFSNFFTFSRDSITEEEEVKGFCGINKDDYCESCGS